MKYLLVLIVVMIGIFVWRANRVSDKPKARRRSEPAEKDAVDMIGCDMCGLHCPRSDMFAGRDGMYCSAQHRKQAEA